MVKMIRSKALSALAAVAMIAFIAPASQAAVIGGLTLTGSPVQGGGSFNVSGMCPAGNTVNYSVVSTASGQSTSIGSVTNSSSVTGSFSSGNLNIPSSFPTGGATLVATCSNGDTVTLPVNITGPAVTVNPTLNVNGTPVAGSGTFSVSGTCPTAGTVNLSLGSGTDTNLGNILSGSDGAFGANLAINASASTGANTLIVTCPNGQTFTTPITISANTNVNVPVVTDPTGNNTGSTVININGTPVQGSGTFGISGTCTNSGNVSFMLNGNSIGSSVSTSGSNNAFNTTLSIPSATATGNATITATCPNGQVLTQGINILAPSSDLLSLNTSAPAINGNINVSGVCGANSNGGTVTFTVSRGGITTNLSTTTTANGANGALNTTLTIPANYPSGLATITATCPNGDTVSSLAVIGNPGLINLAIDPLNLGVNGSMNLTGVCPSGSTGVNFSVLQNGVTTTIGGTTALAGNNSFSTTLSLPSAVVAGTANVIATCNNNGGATTVGVTVGSNGAVAGVSTPLPTGNSGAVAGVATPVGGVAAGNGGMADSGSLVLFFLLTGVVAMAALYAGKQMQNNA